MKPHQYFSRFEGQQSPVLALSAGAGQIDLGIDVSRVHNFAGIVFYSDAEGTTSVQPSAGTITYTVRLFVQPHGFQAVPNNVLEADRMDQVNWAGNTDTVRAVLAGIVGATHARLFVAGNSA